MAEMKEILVLAESQRVAQELLTLAGSWGESSVLVYGGPADTAPEAGEVFVFDPAKGIQGYLPFIAERAKSADLVLAEGSVDCRLVAAAAAVARDTAIMSDPMSVETADGKVSISKMVYGGAAVKVESAPVGSAVVVAGEGLVEAGEIPAASSTSEAPFAESGVKLVSHAEREVVQVNLAAAKKVVGVGRGLGDGANMALVESFAGKIGAELGCTRPVAEEEKWLPKERYLGVSGKKIKPDVYIALGISGQVQHMVGVNTAGTIVAVNKDKNAAILTQCDLGIVGDLTKIVPAVEAML